MCVETVVSPCLQSGSCPGCRCVCPWSAPGCAARSSSGSSPTPVSSSPPPSAKKKPKKKNNHQSDFFVKQTGTACWKKKNQYITSWYFFVCQLFHRSQWSSSCGSRLGADRAALRHTANTATGSMVASYWKNNNNNKTGS